MRDDLISRQAAKLKVARVIWEDGDSCYDFHDKCVDCLDDVPSAQPESCDECKHLGKWENEVEYGYPSPCTHCKRRARDHYER